MFFISYNHRFCFYLEKKGGNAFPSGYASALNLPLNYFLNLKSCYVLLLVYTREEDYSVYINNVRLCMHGMHFGPALCK